MAIRHGVLCKVEDPEVWRDGGEGWECSSVLAHGWHIFFYKEEKSQQEGKWGLIHFPTPPL